jgi:hypothetical protein
MGFDVRRFLLVLLLLSACGGVTDNRERLRSMPAQQPPDRGDARPCECPEAHDASIDAPDGACPGC